MAQPANPLQQYYIPIEKFGGEDDEDVEVFLDSLELSFERYENTIPDEPRKERAKVAAIYRNLTGMARDCWKTLGPSNKTSYDLASSALKKRFPKPDEESEYRAAQNRAIVEMNTLVQGERTTEEYVKMTVRLYGILGDNHALSLATKFVDGITNPMVQVLVDTQTKGDYTSFMDVINAFKISTTTIRRQELALQAPSKNLKPPKQDYQQMVYHMSELFKGIVSTNQEQQEPSRAFTHAGYQPIVGTVSQSQANSGQQSQRQSPVYPGRSQQAVQSGYQPTYQRGGFQGRPRNEIVCFRCGGNGHRVYECQSTTPLPREEQERLRNNAGSRGVGSYSGPYVAPPPGRDGVLQQQQQQPHAVVCVEVPDDEDGTDPAGMMLMSTNLVDIMVEEREQSVLRRLKAGVYSADDVAYIVAMAEKRTRADRSEDPLAKAAPASQRQRTRAGTIVADEASPSPLLHESITVNPPPSVPPSQFTQTQQKVPATPPQAPHEPRPFVPDPYFEDPANHSQFIPSASLPKSRQKRKTQEPRPKRHIKMMHGCREWDPVNALRGIPVTGLDFGNLLDIAPAIRIAVCKSLQLEKGDPTQTRSKTQRRRPLNSVVSAADINAVSTFKVPVRPEIAGVKGEALPEPIIRFFNFHTFGDVVRPQGSPEKLDKILIDGGAVVNLMPEVIARRLGLLLIENNDIRVLIRTATNEIRPIQYCTQFCIRIAGVTTNITAHVLDIPQSYSLLLGRRWLYQVRAFGDYAAQAYVIYDREGQPHSVPRSGNGLLDGRSGGPSVLVNPLARTGSLTEFEKAEIVAGPAKMQDIIADVVADAIEQNANWQEDAMADEIMDGSEEEDELIEEDDYVYEYPGSGDEMGNDIYHRDDLQPSNSRLPHPKENQQ